MTYHNDKLSIKQKVKRILAKLPEHDISDVGRREFISRLYDVSGERRHTVEFTPIKRALVFSSASAVLASLIIAFNFLFIPMYPAVTNVEGTVKIYRASKNEWVFARASGMRLYKNDILKTFSDGHADLVIPNVYHMRLKRDSEIRLSKSISRASQKEIGYILEKGTLLAYYNKHRKLGKELQIQTPQAIATALGTDFMVESRPLINQTWVGVLDGTVKVANINEVGISREAMNEVLVKAGEKTVVRAAGAPSKPVPLLENELLNMEELYNIGKRPQVALLISTGSTRTRELLSVLPLYMVSDERNAMPEKIDRIVKEFNQAIREGSKKMHIESIRQLEAIVNDHPNPKYDVQFLLFIGAYYAGLNEDQKAISTFERVRRDYPKSALASIAQCAIGIIYEEKLKDSGKARDAYRKVLSDYPNSPEVEEASAGLVRLTK